MFSSGEDFLKQFERKLENLIKSEGTDDNWSPEDIEKAIAEEQAEIREFYKQAEPKVRGLSKISKILKRHDEELSKLVWKIPFTASVTEQEITKLTKDLSLVLKDSYNQEKVKALLEPLVSRNSEFIQKKIEAANQQAEKNRQRRLAAEQEARFVIALGWMTQDRYLKMPKRPFDTFEKFDSWRDTITSKIENGEKIDESEIKWLNYFDSYKKTLRSQTTGSIESNLSSSSSSDENSMDTESTTKQFLLSKKRKESFEEEERKSPPLRATSSDSTKSPSPKKE